MMGLETEQSEFRNLPVIDSQESDKNNQIASINNSHFINDRPTNLDDITKKRHVVESHQVFGTK